MFFRKTKFLVFYEIFKESIMLPPKNYNTYNSQVFFFLYNQRFLRNATYSSSMQQGKNNASKYTEKRVGTEKNELTFEGFGIALFPSGHLL